jgi:hypothetical protein
MIDPGMLLVQQERYVMMNEKICFVDVVCLRIKEDDDRKYFEVTMS